jgi:hypothetical protein
MITRNVIEQNPIGFPIFMFLSCESYQLVLGTTYMSIGTTPTWPQMVEPTTNNVLTPKLVSRVLEIIDIKDPLDDDDMSSKRRHNPKLRWIIPTQKMFIGKRITRPSLIRSGSGPLDTIAIYNMQFESKEAQYVMWTKINQTMFRFG